MVHLCCSGASAALQLHVLTAEATAPMDFCGVHSENVEEAGLPCQAMA